MHSVRSCAAVLALIAVSSGVRADTVTIGPAKDNTLYEEVTGLLSNGAGSYFFAGNTNTPEMRRALIKFDIAAAVPAGATITGATLRLRMSKTTAGTVSNTLHRVLKDWGETTTNADDNEGQGGFPAAAGDATWLHTFYSNQFWTNAGGDFVAASSAATNVGGVGIYTWTSAQVIADVQSWLDGPAANFGWMIRGPEGAVVRRKAKRFDSRTNTDTSGVRPQLIITFTPPPPPMCEGDFDGDLDVDFADITFILNNFGLYTFADITLSLANFGRVCT